jgi:hypothetical protein
MVVKIDVSEDSPFSLEEAVRAVVREFVGRPNTARTRAHLNATLNAVLERFGPVDLSFVVLGRSDAVDLFFVVVDLDDTSFDCVLVRTQAPRFEHDCSACKYLGSTEKYDHYYCDQLGGTFPTVIARWGDAPEAYASGLHIAKAALPADPPPDPTHDTYALRVSYLIAKRNGLVE